MRRIANELPGMPPARPAGMRKDAVRAHALRKSGGISIAGRCMPKSWRLPVGRPKRKLESSEREGAQLLFDEQIVPSQKRLANKSSNE